MLRRQIASVLMLAALFATLALIMRPQDARPAAAPARTHAPTAAWVAAALTRNGVRDARCLEPHAAVYVCAFDYRGYCAEEEIAWTGTRFVTQPVAARRGRCAWARSGGKGPPA